MKDTYYIGFTGDVITERIRKHTTNHKGFTGGIGDWIIKYTEVYPTKKKQHEIPQSFLAIEVTIFFPTIAS